MEARYTVEEMHLLVEQGLYRWQRSGNTAQVIPVVQPTYIERRDENGEYYYIAAEPKPPLDLDDPKHSQPGHRERLFKAERKGK